MAKIHKVVNGDELIYPATITDAVGHKETRSPLSDLINYYNADLIWPQAVGTYHTLSEVISKLFDTLEEKHRVSGIQVGFKCSIPGKDPEYLVKNPGISLSKKNIGEELIVGYLIN